MEDKYIRYIDIDDDGIPRPLAASNLKKSGRIVIGIEGVHTRDDADVLVHDENDDDSAHEENAQLLREILDDETFNEVVFLSGKFSLVNWSAIEVQRNGITIRGCGTSTVINMRDTFSLFSLIGDNISIKDLKIYADYQKGTAIDVYGSYCIIENVSMYKEDSGVGIKINSPDLHCVVRDCKFTSGGYFTNIDGEPVTTIGSTTITESEVEVLKTFAIGETMVYNAVEVNSYYIWFGVNVPKGLYAVTLYNGSGESYCSVINITNPDVTSKSAFVDGVTLVQSGNSGLGVDAIEEYLISGYTTIELRRIY